MDQTRWEDLPPERRCPNLCQEARRYELLAEFPFLGPLKVHVEGKVREHLDDLQHGFFGGYLVDYRLVIRVIGRVGVEESGCCESRVSNNAKVRIVREDVRGFGVFIRF